MNNNINTRKKIVSYSEAKAAALGYGIKSKTEYRKAFKTNEYFRKNLPSSPRRSYGEEWKGWGEFLNNGHRAPHSFVSYEDASVIVRSNKVSSYRQYLLFVSKTNYAIPANPAKTYADKWKGWNEFLGTELTNKFERKILGYNEMKKLLKDEIIPKYNIKTPYDYINFSKTDDFKKYKDIPKTLYAYTRYKEFSGMHDLLSITDKYTYEELKDLFSKNNIDSIDSLVQYCSKAKDEKIPEDIEKFYNATGDWNGWDELLSKPIETPKTIIEYDKVENVLQESKDNYSDQELDDLIKNFDEAYLKLKLFLLSKKK